MSGKPNILWICSDQQRSDTLGCYGNQFVKTPNLDALAQNGVKFNNAFAVSPFCTPSRAAMLTGRYPRTCSGRQNGAEISKTEVLVTKLLTNEAYCCGLSGKLHLSACQPEHIGSKGKERRIDDGFEDKSFHWSHHSPSMGNAKNEYWDWLASKGIKYDPAPFEDGRLVQPAMTRDTSQVAWCTEKAIDFIEGKNGSPWFFMLNCFDPHHPFDPPMEFLQPYLAHLNEIPLPNYIEGELNDKPIWQKYDMENGGYGLDPVLARENLTERDHRLLRVAYWAMCDMIDYHVGRLIDTLRESGQLENTIVIFSSDHGEMLGDHGIYLKGPFFYDCAIKVPLIISMPGTIKPAESDALLELLDIPQTLLEACGVKQYHGMMGKSLWPILIGQADPKKHKDCVYCENYNGCNGHNGGSELPSMNTMVRTEKYKLTVAHGYGTGELYDLVDDPNENRNLWFSEKHLDIKSEMLVRLTDKMAFTVDPLPERQASW